MEKNQEKKIEEINMKKILFLLLMSCISICTQAQALQEVRGVETKMDYYNCDNNGRFCRYEVVFTNQNSFPISLDVEFWAQTRDGFDLGAHCIIATKQFELAPKETYRWYTEKYVNDNNNAYVKYKAYKSPNLVTD